MRLCPKCSGNPYVLNDNTYKCKECLCRYSETSGTVFHARKLPMEKLNKFIELMKEGKNAHQISKILKIQYKSAYYLSLKVGGHGVLGN